MSKGSDTSNNAVSNIKRFPYSGNCKKLWSSNHPIGTATTPITNALPNHDVHIFKNLHIDGKIMLDYVPPNTTMQNIQAIKNIYLDELSNLDIIQFEQNGQISFKIEGETSPLPCMGIDSYDVNCIIALLIAKIQKIEAEMQAFHP
jgi:hypothetical protein